MWSKAIFAMMSVILVMTNSSTPASANSKYAGMVYDVNTGKVLYSRSGDSLRYPASLTKMMTLYMVFDALDRGKLSLNTKMRVSSRAAGMPPSKLGLPKGSSIRVKDAILSLVTKSANDVAVVVAEHLGGTESGFAVKMTKRARQLGMNKTTFKNASGLPNSRQKTTARDMVKLGEALRTNHRKHFKYFSTTAFKYGKRRYGNHNKLLNQVPGVNGIKTGYTRASGFNLVTNVEKDGRHIIAVVMGGTTGARRDAQMRKLIAAYMPKASRSKKKRRNAAPALVAVVDPVPLPSPNPKAAARAVLAKAVLTSTIKVPTRLATAGSAYTPLPVANPTYVANNIVSDLEIEQGSKPDNLPVPLGRGDDIGIDDLIASSGIVTPMPVAAPKAQSNVQVASLITPTVAPSQKSKPEGWKIQIAAAPTLEGAEAILKEASARGKAVLKNREPYTERYVKGKQTHFRARFAGFESKSSAWNACKHMTKKRYNCIAIVN